MAGPSIPASQIVSVTPGVLTAGGTALDLNGVFLTTSFRVPVGAYLSFPTYAAVATFFGPTSIEAQMGVIYFLGSTNSTKKPGALLFYRDTSAASSAYVQSASIANIPISQLQVGGSFNVTIDGGVFSTNLNLNSATSYASIATLIQTALTAAAPIVVNFTGSISGTTLTVTAVSSGTLAPGQVLGGTGVTAGNTINSQLTSTATGGALGTTGTYQVSISQTLASGSVTGSSAPPVVTYDVVSGSLVITSGTMGANSTITVPTGAAAPKIFISAANNPTISQGSAATAYGAQLTALLTLTTNWALFTTVTEPSTANKLALAAWANSTNNDYGYAMWDTTSTGAIASGDVTSAGYQVRLAGYSGTVPIWAPINGPLAGAAILGFIASIDFTAPNGRTDAAFQSQAGLVPDVTSGTIAFNLQANGYNYFGNFATANQQFQFFYNGTITGKFLWIDSYVNQIWLTNQCQLALLSLLTSVKSIPYNAQGYGMIEEAIRVPVLAGLSFGAIRAGVVLSASQISTLNGQAGNINIATTVAAQGYYIQILDPGAQVREARGSPVCNLWYTDGQSVQQINLSSIDVL